MNNKTTRNSILLLVTAAVWGAAFVAQTVGGQTIGAYSFNCVRCIIGALVLIPVMKFLDKKDLSPRKPQTKEDYKLLIKGGICCGVALCISTNLQQVGILMGASAGKAGFLTAVYILLVPILGLFLHKKCGINIWFAVALALVGLYFLCMQDKNGFQPADLLLLCCALGFSIQILFVDYFSPKVDGVRLSMIQFLVTGLQLICSIQFRVSKRGRQPFYHGQRGFRFCMRELCHVVWDIRYRSLDRMDSILQWLL